MRCSVFLEAFPSTYHKVITSMLPARDLFSIKLAWVHLPVLHSFPNCISDIARGHRWLRGTYTSKD